MKQNPNLRSFIRSIWDDRENRFLFLLAFGLQIVAWLIYKWCLPGLGFFADSYSYIAAATYDNPVFYRPAGYSRFLTFIHGFSASPGLLVTIQYFLMSWAAIGLFFTIDHLLRFRRRWLKWISWALVTLQPLLLVLANLVASDSLFTALTALWVTLLLWILLRPGWLLLIAQAILLCLAIQVRYNALYYPLISCLVFLLSCRASLLYRAAGIGLTALFTGLLYRSIRTTTERETGADVFSGFSGWQMANNALYFSPHIALQDETFDDPDQQLLHRYVRQYIDSLSSENRQAVMKSCIGGAFLWDNGSPLKKYLHNYCYVNRQPYLSSWYQVSTLYGDYGRTLIIRHPREFCRYFLWPNTRYFFVPDLEYMAASFREKTKMPKETAEWFGWNANEGDPQPQPRFAALQACIVAGYPILHVILILLCLFLPLGWLVAGRRDREGYRLFLFWYLLFLSNMVFSITAAAVVLRYESVWFVLGGGIPVWFFDRILQPHANIDGSISTTE